MLIENQIPARSKPRKAHTLLQVQNQVFWVCQCLPLAKDLQQLHSTPQLTWLLEEVPGLLRATCCSQQSHAHIVITILVATGLRCSLCFTTFCHRGIWQQRHQGVTEISGKGSNEGKNPRQRENLSLSDCLTSQELGTYMLIPLEYKKKGSLRFTSWNYLCYFTYAEISYSKH